MRCQARPPRTRPACWLSAPGAASPGDRERGAYSPRAFRRRVWLADGPRGLVMAICLVRVASGCGCWCDGSGAASQAVCARYSLNGSTRRCWPSWPGAPAVSTTLSTISAWHWAAGLVRCELTPHNGQAAVAAVPRAVTTSVSSPPSTLSVSSPGGISDAKPNRGAMDAPVMNTMPERHGIAADVAARAPDTGKDCAALAKNYKTPPASSGIVFDGDQGRLSEIAFLHEFAWDLPRPK